MADPLLTLHNNANGTDVILATNDNWGDNAGAPNLSTIFNQVGAFPLSSPTSKDAALVASVDGARTVHINSSVSGDSGVVLLETYDMENTITNRLVNVSARNRAGTGAESLIVGFVIDGNQPKRVLIRGVGPAMIPFLVPNTIQDPKVELYESLNGTSILRASNNNWGDEPGADVAAVQAGAFALPAGSKDAAIVISLPPGAYTAIVSGADGGTGEALVELYELP